MSRLYALLAAVALAGCPGEDPPQLILDCPEDAGTAVTADDLYAELGHPICSQCHFAGSQSPPLSSPQAFEALVDAESPGYAPMKVVVPGELRSSLLYLKVMGGTDAGYVGPAGEDTGHSMPRGGPPLPETQRHLVRRWICQGAP